MILESRFAPSVSTRSMFVIALLAFLVLPSFVQTTKTEARAGINGRSTAAAGTKAGYDSDFRFPVRDPIRARRDPLPGWRQDHHPRSPRHRRHVCGRQYLLDQGNYTLASHDRATLAASITAVDAANGRSTPLKVQIDHRQSGQRHVHALPADVMQRLAACQFLPGRRRK